MVASSLIGGRVAMKFCCLLAVVLSCLGLMGTPIAAAAAEPPLDGAVLHYLPPGLGVSSDFHYRFARVRFASRIWESHSAGTGWQVDLDIVVMRGGHMSTPRDLHDWFIRYEQRSPSAARYRPVRIRHHVGWATRDQVFWLVRPGVGTSVQLDRTRWSRWELFHTARSVAVPARSRRRVMTETGTRSSLAA
jgi:hypothetical protein